MKSLLTVLLLSSMFAMPAMASHHKGKAPHDKTAMMKDGAVYADQAAVLMNAGNRLIQRGYDKKNAKDMLHGTSVYFKGFKMHKHSMHGMKETHHELKHKLMHAKVGDKKMSATDMKKLEVTMKGLKSFMESHKKAIHAEMTSVSKNAHMLVSYGAQLIKEGKTSLDSAKLAHGAELMDLGMKFHMHADHKNHHKGKKMRKMIKKRMMKSGGNYHKEVEIEIHR